MGLAERMSFVNNKSSGFDYLRVVLASVIIIRHALPVSYGAEISNLVPLFMRVLELATLPMFFSLSGFLVAGSPERSKQLHVFFGLRVLRIVPALAGEVTLSALILGPIFTTAPLSAYFTDSMFYEYFLNILGHIHFFLPGVFPDNPLPNFVKVQLWTIPFELECYVAIGVLAVSTILRRPRIFLSALILIQIVFAVHGLHDHISAEYISVGGYMFVFCFLVGVALYVFRSQVPFSGWGGESCQRRSYVHV